MLKRRTLLTTAALATVPLALPQAALAQGRKDTLVIGMTLEPPGLDPTTGAASAIAEISHYNIYETLTKINADGKVTPLLAESWEVSPDLRTYTFKLRRGVKFQNGEPFNAQTVKFAFDRAGGEKSTNKDKRTFANLSTQVIDDYTVVVINKEIDPDLPFVLGQATAVLVEPKHPVIGEFSGEIRGSLGNHEMKELYGAVNVPVSDKLALRFAGVSRRREGWAHEVTTGRDYDNQHYDAFRASALFQPSDNFQSLTVLHLTPLSRAVSHGR
jgi:hypothetical protein